MSADAPYLELLDGEMKGTQFRLLGDSISIGRSADCDICLDGVRGVSRKHAQVMILDGRVRVRDLGSQNGTLVEGKRVKDAVIGDGATVTIGEVRLRLAVPASREEGAVLAAAQPRSVKRQSSRRVQAPGGNAVGPAAGAGVSTARSGADLGYPLEEPADGSRRLLAMLALVVVTMAAVLYAAAVLMEVDPWRRQQQAILTKGQTRVVPVRSSFASTEVKGVTEEGSTVVEVKEYSGCLVESLVKINHDNSSRGLPALWFLVVRGQARGDADIYLKEKTGKPFKRIEVVVRGINETEWETEMPEGEARTESDRLQRDAERLAKDGNIYEAIQLYERASRLVGQVLREESRALDIHDRALGLKRDLNRELVQLFNEAMLAAFPPANAPGKRSLRSAFDTLAAGKRMLREDEDNLEWQIFDYWQAEIRRMAR